MWTTMRARNCNRRTHRAARTAATVVAASVALVAGCAESPAPPARSGSTPTITPSIVFRSATALPLTHTDATAATATSSPVDVAERWLAAYRSVSWNDGVSTVWIQRVRPYVTATLDAQDELYADAGGGADWRAFVAQQCTSTVGDLGAVIPPESPRTATGVNVQVSGIVHTTCDAGQSDIPTGTASATLVLVQAPDGSWRVNQRLY